MEDDREQESAVSDRTHPARAATQLLTASASAQQQELTDLEREPSFSSTADSKEELVTQGSPYQLNTDFSMPQQVKLEREDDQVQLVENADLHQSQQDKVGASDSSMPTTGNCADLHIDADKTNMAVAEKQMAETGRCHFDIGSLDIFNKWWGIGSARGLTTDAEIASFLIALYENTESAVQSAARCVRCHTPLTLVCTKCQLIPQQTTTQTGAGKPQLRQEARQTVNVSESFTPGVVERGSEDEDRLDSDPKYFATSSVQADTWDSLIGTSFASSSKRRKRGRKLSSAKSGGQKVKGFGKIKLKLKPRETKVSVRRSESRVSDHDDEDDAAEASREQTPVAEGEVKSSVDAVTSLTDDTLAKKYSCNVCDAAFARSTHLKRHQRIHTGERPYVCSECGHSFTRSTHLKRHELIHTRPKPEKREKGPPQPRPKKPKPPGNEKPFVCEECGSAFGSSTDLKIHRRIHTGEKPYLCKDCGAAFITSGNLRRHERTHSGDRPYLCQECCASFTRSADLNRHMKCHTGEKAYFCKECGAGFASFSFLRMHKRTHLEDMPYVCGLCNAAFCTPGSLKRHSHGHYGDIPMVY